MKKLLTLTLSLLMVFSLCLTVSADETTVTVSTAEELTKAIENASASGEETIIQLTKEIDTDTNYVGINIGSSAKITLDLNGNKLYTQCINLYGESVNKGYLTIIDSQDVNHNGYGGGEIQLTKLTTETGAHICVSSYATLTLESGLITLYSESDHSSSDRYVIYGAWNSTVNISGGRIAGKEAPVGANETDTTVNITGGTFNRDVSAYLGEGCSIAYSTTNRNYVVYKQGTSPTVNEATVAVAAMSEEARTNLKDKTFKGNYNSDYYDIEVKSSTRLVLTSEYIKDFVEAAFPVAIKSIDSSIDTTNLKYIPLEIELTAYKEGSNDPYKIYDLGDIEIPVTLYLSDDVAEKLNSTISNGYKIRVLREHDSNLDLIEENITLDGNKLTFYTGKFSSYTIVYDTSSGSDSDSDSSSSTTTTTTPTKTYDAKDKNKDGVVSCEEEMNSANWVWSTTKGACVYSVTNTSAK